MIKPWAKPLKTIIVTALGSTLLKAPQFGICVSLDSAADSCDLSSMTFQPSKCRHVLISVINIKFHCKSRTNFWLNMEHFCHDIGLLKVIFKLFVAVSIVSERADIHYSHAEVINRSESTHGTDNCHLFSCIRFDEKERNVKRALSSSSLFNNRQDDGNKLRGGNGDFQRRWGRCFFQSESEYMF